MCAVEEDTIRASHVYRDLLTTLTFKAQPNGAHHAQWGWHLLCQTQQNSLQYRRIFLCLHTAHQEQSVHQTQLQPPSHGWSDTCQCHSQLYWWWTVCCHQSWWKSRTRHAQVQLKLHTGTLHCCHCWSQTGPQEGQRLVDDLEKCRLILSSAHTQ